MTKEEAIELVKNNAFALEHLDAHYKSDKDVVLASVSKNGLSLKFASEQLQNDEEIVRLAIKRDDEAINFASMKLKEDASFIDSLYGHMEVVKVYDTNLGKNIFEIKGLNLQVWFEDFNGPYKYFEGERKCESIGEGWRLPYNSEWKQMYIHMYLRGIGDIEGIYWGDFAHDKGVFKNSLSAKGYSSWPVPYDLYRIFPPEFAKVRPVRSI